MKDILGDLVPFASNCEGDLAIFLAVNVLSRPAIDTLLKRFVGFCDCMHVYSSSVWSLSDMEPLPSVSRFEIIK